ncbi:MAG: hypothetical protein R3B06_10130 [Kofleriaceae bacterium]
MKAILLCLGLAACAGPSQQQLRQTPTATTPRSPSLAPPASGSDRDRYEVTQGFEDQRDVKEAHRQAEAEREAPPGPVPGMPGTAPPGPPPPPTPPAE